MPAAVPVEPTAAAAHDDPGKVARVLGVHYRRIMKGKAVIGTWTEKGWRCEHGRARNVCKACGGASVCEHGRVRSQCKPCGGDSNYEHGRVWSQCKACVGASICKHGRERSVCKACGG